MQLVLQIVHNYQMKKEGAPGDNIAMHISRKALTLRFLACILLTMLPGGFQ